MLNGTCATQSYNVDISRHVDSKSCFYQPIADDITNLSTSDNILSAHGVSSQPALDAKLVNIDTLDHSKTRAIQQFLDTAACLKPLSLLAQVSLRRPARASSLWQSPCIVAKLAGYGSGNFLGDNGEQQHSSDEFQTQNIYAPHGLHPLSEQGSYMQPQPQHHAIPHMGRNYSIGHGTTSIDAGPAQYHPHYQHMAQQHPPQPQSQYGAVPQQQDYPPQQHRSKRPRSQDSLALQVEGMQGYSSNVSSQEAVELTPGGHHVQLQSQGIRYGQQSHAAHQQQTHHHHRMPGPPPPKMSRGEFAGGPLSPSQMAGPPSVVGQDGMPAPAPRPRGPKLKFTPEDDQLLVDLKEKKNLTWKQIADFFPGRSSGTLQVRYCTKLKAKTTVWNNELVQKLRTAMQEYENDKWRIIASKVGSGFSPASCKDKAQELDELEGLDEQQAEEEHEQDEQEEYGSIEPRT